uniref:Uncharacterized protein n=1 Tax=Meloidogyne javanica TaxID=6303 RepID=A0A915MV97_MELJA
MEPIELKGFYYQHERENGQLDYKIVSPQELGRYVVHSPVDNELLEKWQFAIDKQIRLYSYSRCWGRSKYYHYLRLTDDQETSFSTILFYRLKRLAYGRDSLALRGQ